MQFLHDSPIKTHGNLKSTNCLVDSRWVVKIADFGLHQLKQGADYLGEDATDLDAQCERLLWRAPELVRDPNSPPEGTQKGDVYSFGIVLYEILGRRGPYGRPDLTSSEIIKHVMQRDHRFRPSLSQVGSEGLPCVRECMVECWAEDPDIRPDFKTIRAHLRPMRKGL
ncbi:hypothetical protein LAZ67_2006927 [Cordylochernes scorpioides]|uniref:guanylate cyclase n=1 Tax=Cordylochernes scorpioides TaxID=51811 RepID=A0ABY6K8Y2_9ARAC|nr:hypothetical protein LAZ67_2006927 [Cordylochernes scorpioides]